MSNNASARAAYEHLTKSYDEMNLRTITRLGEGLSRVVARGKIFDVATPDMLKDRLRDEVLEEALPL